MQAAVGLFRECWGVKRPRVKALQQRARMLGYHYAQLYFIDGNWWLALAMSACSDAVLGLSETVKAQQECWILANHSQGPLLIVWRHGRLTRICQQSLEACAREFQRDNARVNPVHCLQHGWLESLPEPWTDAVEVNYCRQQRLLPLEQMNQLPVFRRVRSRQGLAALLGAVVVGAVIIFWPFSGSTTTHLTTPTTVPQGGAELTAYVPRQRLPIAAVSQPLASAATPLWQGAWQLQRIELQAQQLVLSYQGQTPLALHSLVSSDSVLTRAKPLQLSRRATIALSEHLLTTSTTLTPTAALTALRRLLQQQRPGLTVAQQGQRWVFNWQHWSIAQFTELAQWLGQFPLHLSALSMTPTPLGWSGEATLVIPQQETI